MGEAMERADLRDHTCLRHKNFYTLYIMLQGRLPCETTRDMDYDGERSIDNVMLATTGSETEGNII